MKQESQRRTRSAVVPERSVVSSTVVQKQVGQTLVQLPQVRQRSATSSHRGWLGLACSNSLSPSVSRCPSHLTPGSVDDPFGGGDFLLGRRPVRQVLDQVHARSAADLHHEQMTAVLDELRQGEVETGLDLRSGIHRDAEAGAARLTAIDRDDKGVVAAHLIGLVEVLAREKDPVLDGDRAQLTGAHADKGERLVPLPRFR